MNRLLARTLALTLTLSGGAALAQMKTVVLGVEAVDAPADRAVAVADALRSQLRQAVAFQLISGKSLEEVKLVFGCVDEQPECMARAGRSMSAQKLVWGSVKKLGSGYRLTVKLLDVARARVERELFVDVSARDLTGNGARAATIRLVATTFPSNTGSIKITSNVNGAAVAIGDRAVGVTDSSGLLVNDVAPGTHELRVTKKGYRLWTQQVTVLVGQTVDLEASLEQEDGPMPATRPVETAAPSSGWRAAFWTSAVLTVGFAGGILGAGLGSFHYRDEKNAAISEYRAGGYVDPQTRTECRKGYESQCFAFAKEVVDSTTGQKKWVASDDACTDAKAIGSGAEKVQNACDKGQTMATLTNVFAALTGAAAIASGIFYYKAYVASPKTEKQAPADSEAAVRWRLTPTVGRDGAALGVHLSF